MSMICDKPIMVQFATHRNVMCKLETSTAHIIQWRRLFSEVGDIMYAAGNKQYLHIHTSWIFQ